MKKWWMGVFFLLLCQPLMVNAQTINQKPSGSHDGAYGSTCSTSGWAFDPDSQSTSILVGIYIDGMPGTGKMLGGL